MGFESPARSPAVRCSLHWERR